MKVRQVMKSPVFTITEDTTYEDAARLMSRNRLTSIPVVDDDGKLIGILSEKDLFKALYPRYEEFSSLPEAYLDQEDRESQIETLRSASIGEFATRAVFSIHPDAPVLKAGGIMLSQAVHQLPVVEDGMIIGMVTRHEIYGAILKRRLDLDEDSADWPLRLVENF